MKNITMGITFILISGCTALAGVATDVAMEKVGVKAPSQLPEIDATVQLGKNNVKVKDNRLLSVEAPQANETWNRGEHITNTYNTNGMPYWVMGLLVLSVSLFRNFNIPFLKRRNDESNQKLV